MSLLEFATILILHKYISTAMLLIPQNDDKKKSYLGTWKFPAVTPSFLKVVTALGDTKESLNNSLLSEPDLCIFMFSNYGFKTACYSQCEQACFTRNANQSFHYKCLLQAST